MYLDTGGDDDDDYEITSADTMKLGKVLKQIWETFLKNCKIFKIKFANFLMKTYASFLQRFVLYLKDAFSADT